MKKIFTSLILLFVGFGLQADPIFEYDFNEDLTDAGWTVIDANEDGKTWQSSELGDGNKVANIMYSSTLDSDDWLISPAIRIEDASVYLLSMMDQGSSYGESMDIFWGTSPTIAAMTHLIVDFPMISHQQLKPAMALFEVAGDQTIYIGFHAKSKADAFRIYLDDVAITPASGVDVSAHAILSPVTGNDLGQETVTVKVKNVGFDTVESIPVGFTNSDGQEVTETVTVTLAPGQSVDYTFAAKIDLSSPRTDYMVKAWTALEADKVVANDTVMAIVRHEAPASLPYFMGFEEEDRPESVLLVDANSDGSTWGLIMDFFDSYARSGIFSLVYNPVDAVPGDDWFILEPMHFAPGYYMLEFYSSALGNDNCPIDVALFNEQDPTSAMQMLSENVVPAASGYVRITTVMKIDEACVRSIGFRTSLTDGKTPLLVDDISIMAIDEPKMIDLSFGNLLSPSSDYLRGQSEDIRFEVKNAGVELAKDVVVEVKLDGQSVGSMTLDLPSLAVETVVMAGKLADLEVGEHVLQVSMVQAEDASADDNVMEKTFTQLGESQLFYDFEDGEALTEDFKLMNKDGIPVADQTTGLFPNNEAFRVVGFEEPTPTFGKYSLVGCSYLSSAVQADRWVVFPAFVVPEDGLFIWDACSMDKSYPETYEVYISESATPDDFTKVFEVIGESPLEMPATHALNLQAYEGKSIHVAFRLISTDCYLFIVDNVGLYGGGFVTALVDTKERKAVSVKIVRDQLEVVAENMNRVCIYDMQGRQVMTTTEQVMSVADWDKGLYLVRVYEKNGRVHMFKVMK